MTMSRPASAALGICSTSPANGRANSRIQNPCRIVEALVFAPALTLAALRTITPAMGRPPMAPDTMFEAPCPISSRSRSVRGPVCIRSRSHRRQQTLHAGDEGDGDDADRRPLPSSRGAAPATAALPAPNPPGRSGTRGTETPPRQRLPARWRPADREPRRSLAGAQRQPTMMAITSTPRTTPGRCAPMIWAGSQ